MVKQCRRYAGGRTEGHRSPEKPPCQLIWCSYKENKHKQKHKHIHTGLYSEVQKSWTMWGALYCKMRHWRQTRERISISEINNDNCMFVCQMYIINKPPFLNQQRLMHNVKVAIQSQKGTGLWKTETSLRHILFSIYTGSGRKTWRSLSYNKMKSILSFYVNLLLKLSLCQSILITILISWI